MSSDDEVVGAQKSSSTKQIHGGATAARIGLQPRGGRFLTGWAIRGTRWPSTVVHHPCSAAVVEGDGDSPCLTYARHPRDVRAVRAAVFLDRPNRDEPSIFSRNHRLTLGSRSTRISPSRGFRNREPQGWCSSRRIVGGVPNLTCPFFNYPAMYNIWGLCVNSTRIHSTKA